jgi:adenine/guanine phosphoribosyltransferase-like PRPP-binding protein
MEIVTTQFRGFILKNIVAGKENYDFVGHRKEIRLQDQTASAHFQPRTRLKALATKVEI